MCRSYCTSSIAKQFAELIQAAAQPSALLYFEYVATKRAGFSRRKEILKKQYDKAMRVVQADEDKFEEQVSIERKRESLFTNPWTSNLVSSILCSYSL